MPTPFEHLASLNRVVHEPARLAILTALSACDKADFVFLLNITGLTKGNLSSHLSKLEQTGLIEIEKRFEGKQPVTYAMLSGVGREALAEVLEALRADPQRRARAQAAESDLTSAETADFSGHEAHKVHNDKAEKEDVFPLCFTLAAERLGIMTSAVPVRSAA